MNNHDNINNLVTAGCCRFNLLVLYLCQYGHGKQLKSSLYICICTTLRKKKSAVRHLNRRTSARVNCTLALLIDAPVKPIIYTLLFSVVGNLIKLTAEWINTNINVVCPINPVKTHLEPVLTL